MSLELLFAAGGVVVVTAMIMTIGRIFRRSPKLTARNGYAEAVSLVSVIGICSAMAWMLTACMRVFGDSELSALGGFAGSLVLIGLVAWLMRIRPSHADAQITGQRSQG